MTAHSAGGRRWLLPILVILGVGAIAVADEPPSKDQGRGKDYKEQTFVWDWTDGPNSPAAHRRDGNWGQKAIRLPAAWNFNRTIERARPNAKVKVAVIDAGFAPHEDLKYEVAGGVQIQPGDHGNHVTGIIAATFGNRLGVDGGCPYAQAIVSPIIHKKPLHRTYSIRDAELYGAITDTLEGLITSYPDLRVVNIGLGYNWTSNFRVDPERRLEAQEIVRTAGERARRVAEIAAKKGILLVCAAGNDSSATNKTEAYWGSPLNWAAMNPGGNSSAAWNILVVESTGRSGERSPLSNIHGHLAAPGEEILSTVAFDREGQLRQDAYGVKSGTAMAAAQVTALIAQMYAYNPGLKPEQIVDIIKRTSLSDPAGRHAPMVDAFAALLDCYPGDRPLHDLADLNHDGRVDEADFKIFRDGLRFAEDPASNPRQDLNGDRLFNDAATENVWPLADLNGSGRLSRDPRDSRQVKGQLLSDLGVMMRAWQDPKIKSEELPGKL
jgi:subtilisin family serine protease